VTITTLPNVYVYDFRTLWISYGLSIFFTALAIVIGFSAMWDNGVAYDSDFSTVLRASRIHNNTAGNEGGGADEINHKDDDRSTVNDESKVDDGSKPLPEYLKRAIVITTLV
jgi:hypothetical protein